VPAQQPFHPVGASGGDAQECAEKDGQQQAGGNPLGGRIDPRRSRAAAFAFGLTVAGCSSTVSGTDATPGDTSVAADTATRTDTAVATDTASGTDVVTARDVSAPEDHGNIAPPYGIPADAGAPPDDDGGAAAEYGAPPMDAGVPDDTGGGQLLYGAPPPADV
jgi:uncharacterized protein YceK